MKAIVYRKYGAPDVVTVAEMPKPTPADNEVLIRIHATTVSSGDYRARSLEMPAGFGLLARPVFGFFGPRQPVLGGDLSGVIEAVGKSVTRFKVGDEVFAYTGAKMGCHAEYRSVAEDGWIALKPSHMSFETAAALLFGGTTALSFLRNKGAIKSGEKVLIIGASGAVGSAAVQIAKHFGAHVTGVCSTTNVDLVRSIGADRVIDYTKEDFTRNGETYDIILNTNGVVSVGNVENSLRRGGRLLLVVGTFAQALGLQRPSRASGKKVISGVASVTAQDIDFLARLAETGEFTPLIDRSYPLELAADAHAYVDTGRKRGNVVLTVGRPEMHRVAA